jgi:hypothetical protein
VFCATQSSEQPRDSPGSAHGVSAGRSLVAGEHGAKRGHRRREYPSLQGKRKVRLQSRRSSQIQTRSWHTFVSTDPERVKVWLPTSSHSTIFAASDQRPNRPRSDGWPRPLDASTANHARYATPWRDARAFRPLAEVAPPTRAAWRQGFTRGTSSARGTSRRPHAVEAGARRAPSRYAPSSRTIRPLRRPSR